MFDESLITSEVCVECGACCSAYIRKDTQTQLEFEDTLDDEAVEVVSCRHLQIADGEHRCRQYSDRPAICRQYHCLKGANERGTALTESNMMAKRIRAAVMKIHGRSIDLVLL